MTAPVEILDSLFRDALKKGQEVSCRVYSGSMMPTYLPGDLLIVDGEKPALGEVAVALIDSQWVTHRVIAIKNETFVLKGDIFDTNQTEFVQIENIIGRVVHHRRDATSHKIRLLRRLYKLIPRRFLRATSNLLPTQLKKSLRHQSLQNIFFSSKNQD